MVHRCLLLFLHLEDIWSAIVMEQTGLLCAGDVSSITTTTLGLGNVANTNPSDLPISNAVSSAMTLKANLSGANSQHQQYTLRHQY